MLFQKLSGDIPDTQRTFRKLTETLETLFGNPQATFRTLRKCSGNSGNVLETHLDTGNTLWKPSVNSWTLRDFLKYLLDALSEILRQLSRHLGNLQKTPLDTGNTIYLEIHQIFPRCSFRNSQATFQTLRKHSGNSLRHWKHSLETFRQLSRHSGNVPETQEMS